MVIACDTACTKKLQRHVPDYIIEKNFLVTDGNCNESTTWTIPEDIAELTTGMKCLVHTV